MYQLEIERQAGKDLDRLRGDTWRRLREAILALAGDPRPPGCAKLHDRTGYRIRAGDYRILYDVDDASQTVTILSIKHRRDAYRAE